MCTQLVFVASVFALPFTDEQGTANNGCWLALLRVQVHVFAAVTPTFMGRLNA